MDDATTCVFSPNKVPDNYVAGASIPLVLRPGAFRSNATDVAGLYRYALDASPHYREIKAPTIVISGDRDKVVYATIHSVGLVRDIPGAELVWVHNLGHKPDWIASDLVVGAIEKAAGKDIDLQAMAKTRGSADCQRRLWRRQMRRPQSSRSRTRPNLADRPRAWVPARPSRYRQCAAYWSNRACAAARRR